MTRIVAGRAGNKTLRVPQKGTRPASELVREALFNALEAAGDVAGARVLDLYAGSGALGLEALSRGADDAVFVEADRRAAEVLRGNIARVGLGGVVRNTTVEAVVGRDRAPHDAAFDLVVADPPFALENARMTAVFADLVTHGWLADEALVIVERPARDGRPEWPDGLESLRERRYGDALVLWAEYCVTTDR